MIGEIIVLWVGASTAFVINTFIVEEEVSVNKNMLNWLRMKSIGLLTFLIPIFADIKRLCEVFHGCKYNIEFFIVQYFTTLI